MACMDDGAQLAVAAVFGERASLNVAGMLAQYPRWVGAYQSGGQPWIWLDGAPVNDPGLTTLWGGDSCLQQQWDATKGTSAWGVGDCLVARHFVCQRCPVPYEEAVFIVPPGDVAESGSQASSGGTAAVPVLASCVGLSVLLLAAALGRLLHNRRHHDQADLPKLSEELPPLPPPRPSLLNLKVDYLVPAPAQSNLGVGLSNIYEQIPESPALDEPADDDQSIVYETVCRDDEVPLYDSVRQQAQLMPVSREHIYESVA